MRALGAALLAITMTVSGAFAADGALAPGKPAGVRHAQFDQNTSLILMGAIGAAAIAIAVVATEGSSASSTSTTTTTTTTS